MTSENIKDTQPEKPRAFTSSEIVSLEDKVLIARRHFITSQSWFGSLVGKLRLKLSTNSKEIPTCATDGETIFFGAKFVDKHSIEELVFVFGHELLHCLLNHHLRKTGGRKTLLWNCACDYVVNDIIIQAKIGTMPKGALHDPKFSGKTCEEIYTLLETLSTEMQEALKTLDDHLPMNGDSSNSNTPGGNDMEDNQEAQESEEDGEGQGGKKDKDSDKPKAMSDEVAEEWTDALTNIEKELATKSAGQKGSLEKSLEKILKAEAPNLHTYESRVNWKEELREFIKCKFLTDLTYMRPNRKTQAMGIVLPSMKTEEKLNIAIALDTSGSMDQEWITNFLAEIQEILLCYEFGSIHLWCFDTRVHNYKILDFTEVGQLNFYKPMGGGGTTFEVNWELMERENITPDLLLMLTDGHPGGSWGDEHVVDACFAIAGDPNRKVRAPFGKTIYID